MTLSQNLHISQTEDTPEVHFNIETGIFRIIGRSLPENAYNFYQPILSFTSSYLSNHGKTPVALEFKMDYFNSSSGRFIFELLTMIEESKYGKTDFKITWLVESDDELMIEKGEELQSLLDLSFEIQKL